MGKGSKPVIGYWYRMGLHFGVCVGPVDALLEIDAGGKVAWTGNQTASGDFVIDKLELFGGEKKEGGVQGNGWIMMGEPTQAPNAYMIAQLGTPMPAFRGLLTIAFHGLVSAMTPYIKPWAFKVVKIKQGWRTPIWQPALAQIGSGMNPAHIIYRAITDPVTGLGKDPSSLNLTKLQAAAQTLYDEGLGLCLRWSRSDVLANFITTICDHVGGAFVDDPTTGKQYLKLYRGDYDIDICPVLDESNIKELTSYEQPGLAGAINEVTVTWHDISTNKDAAVTVQNLALVNAQGRVISQSTSYTGLWSQDLATRVAQRDLRAVSSLPARIKCKVKGSMVIAQGDVLAFSWARLNVAKMPVRVLEIDRGDPTDSTITLTLAQDVYSLPTSSYIVQQPSLWTAPNTAPAPVPDQVIMESTWRDLASRMSQADLNALDATAGYVGTLGDRPPCVAYSYDLATRIGGSGDFVVHASGAFAPTGLLQGSMAAESGPTAVALSGGVDLDQVEVGSEALVDTEIMRVIAIDATAGTCTLARGCVDTLPQQHALGARVWFTDGYTGADPTEYFSGEKIQAKLLVRAGDGTLDQSLATTLSVTLAQRAARPYPPAAMKINGVSSPASITAPLAVTFARRNRLTQADQLIDATAGDMTPETGQTTTLQVFDSGGTKVHEETGIAGTASTPWSPAAAGTYSVKLFAVRDTLASTQTAQWSGIINLP